MASNTKHQEMTEKKASDSSLSSSTRSRHQMNNAANTPSMYKPISNNPSRLQQSRSRSQSRQRTNIRSTSFYRTQSRVSVNSGRSYGGEDGYSVNYHHEPDSDRNKVPVPPKHGDEAANGEPNGGDVVPSPDTEKASDLSNANDKDHEVTFNPETDPQSPRLFSKARKWLIVLVIASSALCVTCTSTLYSFTYGQLTVDFGVSREVATLGVSIFVAGLGLGPMVLSPLSEFYGRRPIYIWSYLLFFVFIFPCAFAPNIAVMLVFRFFDGLAGSAFLSVAGGTIGDMFSKSQLSLPMMVYTASPFIGPELGPLLGGFINQYADWRWSFYVLLIWSGVQLILILFLVPETYFPVLIREKAKNLRKETGDDRWWAPIDKLDRSVFWTIVWSCIRPFQLLVLEPMCLNLCLLSAILLGILYLFFGAFPLVFEDNHGFTLSQVGLTFLGILVGMLVGIISNPLWHRNYARLVQKNGGVSEPEFRLPPTVVGAWLVVIGLFGFGWTTFPSVPWIVPIIFSGIFGLGTLYVFSGVFTFLVECYPLYAASALAANSFARSSFAAAFPLFGVQMYRNLGYQWATTLLAFLSLALAPFPIIFFLYGKRIRGKSRFAAG